MVKVYYMKYPYVEGNRLCQKNLEKKYSGIVSEKLQTQDKKRMYFSKSHCPGWILIGQSDSIIGCDVERIYRDWDPKDTEKRLRFYLLPEQAAEILNSSNPQLGAILAWTRKESYFKACQKRKVPTQFLLSDPTFILSDEKMKFVSFQPDIHVIMTCYTNVENEISWIEVKGLE